MTVDTVTGYTFGAHCSSEVAPQTVKEHLYVQVDTSHAAERLCIIKTK
jgi:hypothetical protein